MSVGPAKAEVSKSLPCLTGSAPGRSRGQRVPQARGRMGPLTCEGAMNGRWLLLNLGLWACGTDKSDTGTGLVGDGGTSDGGTSDGGTSDGGGDTGGPCADDNDCDGYLSADDCDDDDPAVHPQGIEICDGIDNNCVDGVDEGLTDTWYVDVDGDGFGDPDSGAELCESDGGVLIGNDCDDDDAGIWPGAPEVCDGVDNNCGGTIDDGVSTSFYADSDGDGLGDAAVSIDACEQPSGFVTDSSDCDDADAEIGAATEEVADGVDNDCDGDIDEGFALTSCHAVLDAGLSTGSGSYTIDPDGSGAAVDVLCDMDIDGGGWTQALQVVLDAAPADGARSYLYSRDGAWYLSPSTTLVWDWTSYQALDGTWSFASSGATAEGSFDCVSAEDGGWGVGCSNGGGGEYKVLPIYSSDPASATSEVCQDLPDVFGVGSCAEDVAIWVREE